MFKLLSLYIPFLFFILLNVLSTLLYLTYTEHVLDNAYIELNI